MKVLLVHLSDIHIDTANDVILSRSANIVDAVKNLDVDIEAAVFILSGDVAYAGTGDQFLLALGFVCALKESLAGHLPSGVSIHFVAVPGNHDCDFSEATDARDILFNAVRENPQRLTDNSFADICLAPLRQFFEFRDLLDHPEDVTENKDNRRLYAEYRLHIKGETIAFCCCNTAALSRLHEQPGSLVFPLHIISQRKSSDDLSFGIFHHPYNWLNPENGRRFRENIESVTDFILTGHEHVLDKRQTKGTTSNNMYLEGGVLQDPHNPARSEFYALIIDTSTKKQRILGFSWNGERYDLASGEDANQYHLWEDFNQNRLRLKEMFHPLSEFIAFLNDPELTLTHRVRGQLHLSDVYVYPDLKRFNLSAEKGTKIIRGELVAEFVTQTPALFLFGDDVSGKTALAKTLFLHLRSRGDVPLFLDGRTSGITAKNCESKLEECFLRQYESTALTAYRQLDRKHRVVFLDNYHRLHLSSRAKIDLLHRLRQHSFRLIILAHDLEVTFQDLSEGGDQNANDLPFVFYSILPFSNARQNQIVEKWLLLSDNADNDTTEFVRTLEKLRGIINTLVGKNYVPAYPPYVLAVLQATEAGTDVDLNASTHGYLYELFIKTAVARHASPIGFNVLSSYLSHISYWMFRQQRRDISEGELKILHGSLHDRFEVLKDFGRQTEDLVQMQLLVRENDNYRFRHPYIHYYFLARYLHDNLSVESIDTDISLLTNHVYREDNANTLLFLSHFSKDRRILNKLIAAAEAQYNGLTPSALGSDVQFLNDLHSTVGTLEIADVSVKESRQEALDEMDAARDEEVEFEETRKAEMECADSFIGRLNAALKTIQILGQFLKNFPANLERSEKDRIIYTCCSLGRRTLAEFLNLVQKNEISLLQEMLFLIGRRKPGIDQDKIRERAVTTIVALCDLAAGGMVTRLSYAIGAKELTATYDRFFEPWSEPIMRLLYVALQLDHYDAFPETLVREEAGKMKLNSLGFRVLRQLVARHLALFPVKFTTKQKLAHLLHLDYKSVQPKKELQLIQRF